MQTTILWSVLAVQISILNIYSWESRLNRETLAILKFAENVRTTLVRNQQLQQFQKIAKILNVILTLQGEIQRAVQVIISLYIFRKLYFWKYCCVQQSSLLTALNNIKPKFKKETRNIGQIDWWWGWAISKLSSRWWMATLLLTLHYWCEVWGTPHRLSSEPDDDPWCLV